MKSLKYFTIIATVMLATGLHNINANAEDNLLSVQDIREPLQIEIETAPKLEEIIEFTPEEPIEIIVPNEKEYRYIDCPLSKETQEGIFDICEEYGISFEFVMAVIAQESSFKPEALGDNCESKGLMQIQKKWHSKLMNELGVTDLYDPLQNVKVGVALLCQYFEENDDVYYVLMKYNGGHAYANKMLNADKVSKYAMEITERAIKYEEENGL